jgi:uncharacterized protein (TIGR00369 family)
MTIKPENYDIGAHYQHWVGDTAEDYLGPFFFVMQGEHPRSAFRVQKHHCNAHNTLHGGIMMALADYTLCLGANGGSNTQSVVTVSCSNEFIAPAQLGDLVEGHAKVLKQGGSIVFVRCELKVDEKIILNSSGVIKRIRLES